MSLEHKHSILLVDDEGNILRQASPGDSLGERPIRLPSGGLPTDMSQPYHGTYTASRGQTFIYAAYPLAGLFGSENPSHPEALILAVPYAGALALWAGFARPFLWAGLIALIASVVIAIFLARSLYLPIQRVTRAAEEMAEGHYDQQVPVVGPEEVKGLALVFNHMAAQVKQSQERLRSFVADVSHELRSPLTSIRGFAQAMLDGTVRDDESRSRAAQIIEDESKRMIRLVDELLELSRIEFGQVQMVGEPVDIEELLGHCREMFKIRASDRGVTLKLDIEQVPPIIGDIDRLEQVISNLLDNALKHTPAGGEVSILARQAAGFVEIAVADTGTGIPLEELPHVFERFYRADSQAMKSGIGLGLAIAREIVRAHGGDIEARSAPGRGAEFIVRLPTHPALS